MDFLRRSAILLKKKLPYGMKPGILKYFWAVHFLKSARTSPPESEVPLQVSQSD
jgi:hypothetical protein